ncbi:hypothetical protein BUALT_Bualt10G0073300 [Buddleja alternifolia]|uniref:Uncharacterized protein n=1 Tax=Buddleja alternifolia TaxID=168488 RepID=A0AAV6WXW7_9LAMI|nr:hypothetical protein BUALT_Bualt10G0073300 [Buddleja alternifolia]
MLSNFSIPAEEFLSATHIERYTRTVRENVSVFRRGVRDIPVSPLRACFREFWAQPSLTKFAILIHLDGHHWRPPLGPFDLDLSTSRFELPTSDLLALNRIEKLLSAAVRAKKLQSFDGYPGLDHFLGCYPFKSKTLQDEYSPEGLCRAAMYALQVKEELECWPEQSHRERVG